MSGAKLVMVVLVIAFAVVVVEEIATWRRWNKAFRETIERHRPQVPVPTQHNIACYHFDGYSMVKDCDHDRPRRPTPGKP